MDDGILDRIDDCFLRPLVDAHSTNAHVPVPVTKAPVKTELQVLRLKDESQKMIMETLCYIHGHDFKLKEISEYQEKKGRGNHHYWEDRGNLVILGGCDFSHQSNLNTEDALKSFALLKLASFGFPKSHSFEALEKYQGNVDQSIELLFQKYFPSNTEEECSVDYSEKELEEIRQEEKAVLESIYESIFEEKERNRVWQLKLELDFLLKYSPNEAKKKTERDKREKLKEKNKNSKPLCPYFAKGNCKFGNRCRFSHNIETARRDDREEEKTPVYFFIEIRFPEKCKYPYETPLILVKTTCNDFPPILLLRLAKMLIIEARKLALEEMSSIYTICELIQNEEMVLKFLSEENDNFLNPQRSLFYEPEGMELNDGLTTKIQLPSHYQKGTTGRDGRQSLSQQEILKEDLKIMRRFFEKQNYKPFENMQKVRQSLPAWSKRDEILELLSSNQVVVISGETGCGKSTQVPQYILDDWMEKLKSRKTSSHVEVICTQPRRLSAIGVAQRVADERTDRIGNTVGYQIRLENKISHSTRLTFCTTGILLRRLQSDPLLENVTHVIVDEVHERSEESDFLLLILKELLEKRKDLKVILMSATLNANLFSNYFSKAPVLDIPGRTFPVQQFFLEDILEMSKFVLEADSQFCRKLTGKEQDEFAKELEISHIQATGEDPPKSIRDDSLTLAQCYDRYRDYSKATCKSLYLMDPMKVNPELIESVLRYVVEGEDHSWPKEGSILVFLPGLAEIQSVFDFLSDSQVFSPRAGRFLLVPLHSTLTNEEQGLIFKKAPVGKRKIVLSTNIAETSVTIDDCVFVLDCGQMKEKRFDSNRNMESLELVWVSRANAAQRKGRAGRVMPGVAIHLYTRHRYHFHILSQPIPEIHRVPLEQLLLRIKTLPNFESRKLESVIGAVIEPPTGENIHSAIVRLQDVGAFDDDQSLTALGVHLATLPVDVRIGKLMLFGAIFQCIDSVLTIAACLSHKSPFVSPFGKKHEADNKKRDFAICNSDHLTVLNAYKRWREINQKSKYGAKVFADENYLSYRTLETLVDMKYQFLELLISIGFVPIDFSSRSKRKEDTILQITGLEMNKNNDNNPLISALLCAALYPNVVKVLTPEKSFTAGVGGAVPRQPLPSELRFKTREDGYVAIHPSSVNSSVGHFNSPFLIYQEKIKTSKIFIRESTMIPILPLVLFSGSDLHIELQNGNFVVLLEDGWIMLQAATHEVAEMLKALRVELAKLLEEKIRDPCLNLLHHDNGLKIISTIVYLLTKE